MAYPPAEIGVIGGSGLYEMEGLTDIEEARVQTPFGEPSESIVVGVFADRRVAFLPRHGKGHRINPSNIPNRANVFAMKLLGVTHLVSVSAVGSLKEEIKPLDMVIPDQIIDRTKGRPSTFFEHGIVAHVAFAEPFCPTMSAVLASEVSARGLTAHNGGTYVAIEGPQFSTVAESQLYRAWGASIIGMTALPEAKLAREAEMCYAVLACSTDYDVWHPDHDQVTADIIIRNLLKNAGNAKSILQSAIGRLELGECSCQSALESAIVTAPDVIPSGVKRDLAPLIGRYST